MKKDHSVVLPISTNKNYLRTLQQNHHLKKQLLKPHRKNKKTGKWPP